MPEPVDASQQTEITAAPTKKAQKKKEKVHKKAGMPKTVANSKRKRQNRQYPASSFTDALQLGEELFKVGGGEKVRRLTLLEKMDRSPTSSGTQMLITNSGKYGLTKGSYAADFLELTPEGKTIFDPLSPPRQVFEAKCKCAIDKIEVFSSLYEIYKEKRLPAIEVMQDYLETSKLGISDTRECLDTFIVNIKDLGLLRTIAGAETLISKAQAFDEIAENPTGHSPRETNIGADSISDTPQWSKTCFYISPIGPEDSEYRKHSDLFLNYIVQPALAEIQLSVVRADHIGEPGMITSQVIEYIKLSALVVCDLSYLNPNVLYELALRHAIRRPIVQIIRKADKLPFDVGQVRTIVLDTTDIYSLVPKIQTYIAEVATLARKAIDDPEHVSNVVSVFYPDFWKKES